MCKQLADKVKSQQTELHTFRANAKSNGNNGSSGGGDDEKRAAKPPKAGQRPKMVVSSIDEPSRGTTDESSSLSSQPAEPITVAAVASSTVDMVPRSEYEQLKQENVTYKSKMKAALQQRLAERDQARRAEMTTLQQQIEKAQKDAEAATIRETEWRDKYEQSNQAQETLTRDGERLEEDNKDLQQRLSEIQAQLASLGGAPSTPPAIVIKLAVEDKPTNPPVGSRDDVLTSDEAEALRREIRSMEEKLMARETELNELRNRSPPPSVPQPTGEAQPKAKAAVTPIEEDNGGFPSVADQTNDMNRELTTEISSLRDEVAASKREAASLTVALRQAQQQSQSIPPTPSINVVGGNPAEIDAYRRAITERDGFIALQSKRIAELDERRKRLVRTAKSADEAKSKAAASAKSPSATTPTKSSPFRRIPVVGRLFRDKNAEKNDPLSRQTNSFRYDEATGKYVIDEVVKGDGDDPAAIASSSSSSTHDDEEPGVLPLLPLPPAPAPVQIPTSSSFSSSVSSLSSTPTIGSPQPMPRVLVSGMADPSTLPSPYATPSRPPLPPNRFGKTPSASPTPGGRYVSPFSGGGMGSSSESSSAVPPMPPLSPSFPDHRGDDDTAPTPSTATTPGLPQRPPTNTFQFTAVGSGNATSSVVTPAATLPHRTSSIYGQSVQEVISGLQSGGPSNSLMTPAPPRALASVLSPLSPSDIVGANDTDMELKELRAMRDSPLYKAYLEAKNSGELSEFNEWKAKRAAGTLPPTATATPATPSMPPGASEEDATLRDDENKLLKKVRELRVELLKTTRERDQLKDQVERAGSQSSNPFSRTGPGIGGSMMMPSPARPPMPGMTSTSTAAPSTPSPSLTQPPSGPSMAEFEAVRRDLASAKMERKGYEDRIASLTNQLRVVEHDRDELLEQRRAQQEAAAAAKAASPVTPARELKGASAAAEETPLPTRPDHPEPPATPLPTRPLAHGIPPATAPPGGGRVPVKQPSLPVSSLPRPAASSFNSPVALSSSAAGTATPSPSIRRRRVGASPRTPTSSTATPATSTSLSSMDEDDSEDDEELPEQGETISSLQERHDQSRIEHGRVRTAARGLRLQLRAALVSTPSDERALVLSSPARAGNQAQALVLMPHTPPEAGLWLAQLTAALDRFAIANRLLELMLVS
jgi:hypothetical protein